MFFLLTVVAALYTIQLRTFHPDKTVNKKKSRFLYYIQANCGDNAEKNPNALDGNERTFNYKWPKHQENKDFLNVFRWNESKLIP